MVAAVFRILAVKLIVDGDKANPMEGKILLNVVAGVDGVPPQAGEVSLCCQRTKFFTDARGGQKVFSRPPLASALS